MSIPLSSQVLQIARAVTADDAHANRSEGTRTAENIVLSDGDLDDELKEEKGRLGQSICFERCDWFYTSAEVQPHAPVYVTAHGLQGPRTHKITKLHRRFG